MRLLYILTLFNMLCFILSEIAISSSDQVLCNLLMFRITSLDVKFLISKILNEFNLVVLEELTIKFITYTAAVMMTNEYLSQ